MGNTAFVASGYSLSLGNMVLNSMENINIYPENYRIYNVRAHFFCSHML